MSYSLPVSLSGKNTKPNPQIQNRKTIFFPFKKQISENFYIIFHCLSKRNSKIEKKNSNLDLNKTSERTRKGSAGRKEKRIEGVKWRHCFHEAVTKFCMCCVSVFIIIILGQEKLPKKFRYGQKPNFFFLFSLSPSDHH